MVVEFRVHLDPLFHLSDLRIWEDSMLFAGRSWHESIQAKLKSSIAAIILVSPGLLDSNYVRNHEIPVFLGYAQSANLPIYCLYLAYSVVDQIFFYPSTGDACEPVKLTDYQGLNSPEQPLAGIMKGRKNKVLRDAALEVYSDLLRRELIRASGPSRLIDLEHIKANGPRRLIGIVDREPTLGRRTLYVRVVTQKPHPEYGKVVRKGKTYPVHWDENVEIHCNDKVEIRECPPRSKTKTHELVRKVS